MSLLVNEATIFDKNDNPTMFDFLPNFDAIYNYIDDNSITQQTHPYGVVICNTLLNGREYNDHLFGRYFAVHPSHEYVSNRTFKKSNVLEFPIFVMLDKNRKPIPTKDISFKNFFTDNVSYFKNIPDAFKLDNGVYQPVTQYRRNHHYVDNILTASYSPASRNIIPNHHDFKIKFSFKERYLHFLTVEEIEYLYKTNELNMYLDEYAFLYVTDELDFLFDENLSDAINHYDAYVESVLIADEDDNIPVLSSYVLLFSTQYEYISFMRDIKHDGNYYPKVISFSSSEAPDLFTEVYTSICNLAVDNGISIEVIMKERSLDDCVEDYPLTVHLTRIQDNVKFIDENVNNGLFIPLRMRNEMSGYGMVEFVSADVFFVKRSFLNLLKIKSEHDRRRIRKITINKFLLDTQSENIKELAMMPSISDIYNRVYFEND